MIADSHRVIAHFVHQLNFHFPLKHIIIGSPLRNIPAIEQQYIVVLFAELFKESSSADKSSFIIIAVTFLIDRFNTTMHIASLQKYKFFSILRK